MPAIRTLPLVLLVACVEPAPLESDTTQHIVGGTQTTTTQHPTVVGLQQGANNWFCSGVLIDKDWVLTTASCFDGVTTAQVRLDDNTLGDNGGKTIAIAEIHKHPNPGTTTWIHDVAMVKLSLSVTDRTPAPLRRTAVPVGTQVVQVGYGVNNNNGSGGGVLRSLNTTTTDCANADDNGITNANLMCFNAGDGTGSCYGDGGAPAFIGGTVAGVASGGTGNSCTSGLDVYTAVMPELTFIDNFLPVTPPPTPPMDPVMPPPVDNPDDPGDPTPVDPPADDDDPPPTVRGCSTGGSSGGVFAIGIALLALRRRSTR